MTVGAQAASSQVDNRLSSLARALRDDCQNIINLQTQFPTLASLVAIGYGSAPNAANPGGVSDAQYALNLINYMSTVAGCYKGTVQQGGNGGTGAVLFNFDNALSALWAGQ